MNKYGFTMVELLATIIILATIMIIAVPSYTSVAGNIKNSNLSSKEKAIESAMLKFANKYLIDQIKPANVKCTNDTQCCKKYDLYTYIVENGVYAAEEYTETSATIINPVTNEKLLGCVKASYNTTSYSLDMDFIHNCNMSEPTENCDEG